jgi:hypothetical protein
LADPNDQLDRDAELLAESPRNVGEDQSEATDDKIIAFPDDRAVTWTWLVKNVPLYLWLLLAATFVLALILGALASALQGAQTHEGGDDTLPFRSADDLFAAIASQAPDRRMLFAQDHYLGRWIEWDVKPVVLEGHIQTSALMPQGYFRVKVKSNRDKVEQPEWPWPVEVWFSKEWGNSIVLGRQCRITGLLVTVTPEKILVVRGRIEEITR